MQRFLKVHCNNTPHTNMQESISVISMIAECHHASEDVRWRMICHRRPKPPMPPKEAWRRAATSATLCHLYTVACLFFILRGGVVGATGRHLTIELQMIRAHVGRRVIYFSAQAMRWVDSLLQATPTERLRSAATAAGAVRSTSRDHRGQISCQRFGFASPCF